MATLSCIHSAALVGSEFFGLRGVRGLSGLRERLGWAGVALGYLKCHILWRKGGSHD